MILTSDSFIDRGAIPGRCAFAVADPSAHVKLSDNRNPHLAWRDLPAGTKSLALVCHDADVPSKPDDVNQEGRQIPATLPRVDFYHWLLVDLKPDGSFRLDLSYFNYCTGLTMTNERFDALFGGPPRGPDQLLTPHHM